jgi:tetratricopeptide (TPR) repeat protein
MSSPSTVRVWTEEVVIPTYMPQAPDKNPMFLENRVYQGSSGKVYPLPFTDRIAEVKTDRKWKAVWLENEYIRVMVLPEIGGRIHLAQDKTNGYDFIYRQNVIKPALVGLAGPWLSGGIEFNWPQHHRPATFLPVEIHIEEDASGAKTVWCGDHDPMARMKGMHGVCLHPGRAYIELKARVYNRTSLTQTFLWWANVATRVHEGYQSFFPPDVYYVADHARRAMSEYPLCQDRYYGVNYGERGRSGVPEREIPTHFIPPHCAGKVQNPPDSAEMEESKNSKFDAQIPAYAPNDLSWYANIPVPTSYMCMGSKEDYFGGYDHIQKAGIVHYASHHIAPGKKQWTWGNHEFGYAWDRNLTDNDGPYIELMAGVYTDNQPDFSFLHPGETKSWSQYWYPIQKIGPAHHANLDAAVSFHLDDKRLRIGVSVSRPYRQAIIGIQNGTSSTEWTADLEPGKPFVFNGEKGGWKLGETMLVVRDRAGQEIIAYRPKPREKGAVPPPASEPAAPEGIGSADELYVTGLHLEQYRHATRCPTLYWREALRRDPLDAQCNNAMGLWHFRRGENVMAEACFRRSIQRLTQCNANPRDGEAFFNLGLCLRSQIDSKMGSTASVFEEAYSVFQKSTWNQAWASSGYLALAEMDCRRRQWSDAREHLNRAIRYNSENLRALDLKAMVLRESGRETEAASLLKETLALDPLDWWARWLLEGKMDCDSQTRLDIAHDLARAGFYRQAIDILTQGTRGHRDLPDQSLGTAPLVAYTLGWLWRKEGDDSIGRSFYEKASGLTPDYCFPSRLEEIAILADAMEENPKDARAAYYLGNLLYDRRRHEEAMILWERSIELDPKNAVAWRNLGIGYFNGRKEPGPAAEAYDRAFCANPKDARLLYERDQLWKRIGQTPVKRLSELEKHPELAGLRDDLTVEICTLYNQIGEPERAIDALSRRHFQPWEGGEGLALGQYVRAQLALGRKAIMAADGAKAFGHFQCALKPPRNLGESNHLLANQSDIHYWLGVAYGLLGNPAKAAEHWMLSACFKGDFQEMSVREYSEMTHYSALSLERLGRLEESKALLNELLVYGEALAKEPAKIDYFATSLPAMLLFDEDIQIRQETKGLFLQAQAYLGLGDELKAVLTLNKVLQRDPNHARAADLLEEIGIRE